ncbi:MAG: hypothetical protein MUO26_12265 [Methanotrichaceae archaeon]|nr:hypothetical protein [Methanotrichaceae archaeon]
MPLSQREEFFKNELVAELRRVENLIRTSPIPEKKIYYFSGAYGITSRTFRYSFSKDVLVADILLRAAYNMLLEQSNRMKTGEQTVAYDPTVIEKICNGLNGLATSFESGESVLGPLETIITAAFSQTGVGNYLKEKGEMGI